MKTATLPASSPPPPVAATAPTMTAIVQDAYGADARDVLRLAEVARPPISAEEVLVRVRAASVDRGTWHIMAGLPYPIRLAGFGLRAPKPLNPGRSVAGVVESVGAQVTAFAAGDEVYGTCEGSFAEFAAASPRRLATKPAGLTFEQAAAVPVSGLTALQAVRDQGRVRAGQRVLVIGAAGGVGSFAVQIAKAYGAEVTGVCRTAKMDVVRGLGADHVVDHTSGDFAGGERYDVIVDTGGNRPLSVLRRALTPRGRLVLVGGETGGRLLGGSERSIRALLLSPFVGQKLGTFIASENAADLAVLRDLVEAGDVRPAVDQTYALSDAAAAVSHVQDGRARGKVVVAI
jgi:NADPH:quinone reductase-like Zn-dependent oxidoreductase